MPKPNHAGACHCGQVRFEVRAPLKAPDACHCRACRSFSGHVFVSVDVPRTSLVFKNSEGLRWYQSSEKVRRGFCGGCGSSLFWDPVHHDWTAVAMGAFEGPTEARLSKHIFVREKGDYYEISDGLPQE